MYRLRFNRDGIGPIHVCDPTSVGTGRGHIWFIYGPNSFLLNRKFSILIADGAQEPIYLMSDVDACPLLISGDT